MTEQEKQARLAADWHHPISRGSSSLSKVLGGMQDFKLSQDDVPLIIKLTENPKHATARFFGGAVDLFSHDCIHVLLGRGLLVKDEAFVIGYTMGLCLFLNIYIQKAINLERKKDLFFMLGLWLVKNAPQTCQK